MCAGEADCTGQVQIILCGRSGRCDPVLRQDTANSESIKLAGVMNTEVRLHPRCAERALTAYTLSGFFHWHSGNSTILSSYYHQWKEGKWDFYLSELLGWSVAANNALK